MRRLLAGLKEKRCICVAARKVAGRKGMSDASSCGFEDVARLSNYVS